MEEDPQEFICSIKRRMIRSIRRVEDYYGTLLLEPELFLEKNPASKEKAEKAAGEMKAIETKQMWKVSRTPGQLPLSVQMEPISMIRIETRAPVFWLSVKRRKAIRCVPLAYNPVLRVLDSLPCEAGCYPVRIHSICDDSLHILCQIWLSPHPCCRRRYSVPSHRRGCPRCDTSEPKAIELEINSFTYLI